MFAWVRGPHKFFFSDLSVSVSMKTHLQEIAMLIVTCAVTQGSAELCHYLSISGLVHPLSDLYLSYTVIMVHTALVDKVSSYDHSHPKVTPHQRTSTFVTISRYKPLHVYTIALQNHNHCWV